MKTIHDVMMRWQITSNKKQPWIKDSDRNVLKIHYAILVPVLNNYGRTSNLQNQDSTLLYYLIKYGNPNKYTKESYCLS